MTEDERPQADVAERVGIEFDVPRGSVPAVRQAAVEAIKATSKLAAVGNVLFSLISIIAAHPFMLGHATLAAVVFASRLLTMNPVSVPPQAGGDVTFTPTNLFFISTTGNDANDGLGPSNAHAWTSPNHAVNCGDVIIAAAGDYSATMNTGTWGTVSNCPSTTGGIDAVGGIYFATLLCAGTDLEACHTVGSLWDMPKSNWAIEGFKIGNTCTGGAAACDGTQRAINFDGCGTGTARHHFAAINNVMYSVASAVHTDDCGPGGGPGVDYTAMVGNIGAQASMNKAFPEAAFDVVGPGSLDTNAGTHHYMTNNYTWNDNAGATPFDSECLMFDTWDAHAGTGVQGVIANNICWSAQRFCIQTDGGTGTPPGSNIITPTYIYRNNTCFRNNLDTTGNGATDNADGEIDLNAGVPAFTYTIKNNIAYQPLAKSPNGGGDIYALVDGGGGINTVTWSGNIFTGSDTACVAPICDGSGPIFNAAFFDGNTVPGSGIIFGVNPGFNNTSDLLTNRSPNTPSCTGFVNTTLCMGWNPNTHVLTNPSVIYDLQPDPNCGSVANQCVGKGFQLPSVTCASSGDVFTDYPVWLKGVVYLHASGFTANAVITQKADLATKRCGF